MQQSIIPSVELTDPTAVDRRRDDLVERASRGDREAFGQLVDAHVDKAFRTASAILGNEADARDATQDAFTAAWINLPRLRDVGRFDAWLNRILMNRCRDVLRGRGRSREVALDHAGVPDTGTIEGRLDITALTTAFERLTVAQRQLLVMHHLHHEPVADIAGRLGIPVGTAKWRLHAARKALEQALEMDR